MASSVQDSNLEWKPSGMSNKNTIYRSLTNPAHLGGKKTQSCCIYLAELSTFGFCRWCLNIVHEKQIIFQGFLLPPSLQPPFFKGQATAAKALTPAGNARHLGIGPELRKGAFEVSPRPHGGSPTLRPRSVPVPSPSHSLSCPCKQHRHSGHVPGHCRKWGRAQAWVLSLGGSASGGDVSSQHGPRPGPSFLVLADLPRPA